ncbi:MAG: adenylate/guanylate cyclase domain-containing protein [Bacteroidota bacterium]
MTNYKLTRTITCQIISVIVLVFAFNKASFSQSVYVIPDAFPEQPLDGFLMTWQDSTKAITAEEILEDTIGNKFDFQPLFPARELNAQSAHWAKLTLHSEVDIDQWHLIFKGKNWGGNGFLRGNGKVDVIEYDGARIIQTEKTGAEVPASEKSIPEDHTISRVPFSIHKGETKHLLIKIEARHNGLYVAPDFGLALIQPEEQGNLEGLFTSFGLEDYELTFSIFLGVLLMAFFYHFVLFVYLRESVYGWFSLWLLCTSITVLNMHPKSFIIEYLFPSNPLLGILILTIFANFVWISFWQFGRDFIGTQVTFPRFDKALRILIGILLVDTLLGLFSNSSSFIHSIYFMLQGLSNLAGIVFACILLFKKDQKARYFGFGALVATLGVLVGVLWFLKVLDLNFDSFATAALLQVFIYSIGLAYRRQLQANEKAAAEKQLLISEIEKAEQLQKINSASSKFVPSTFLNFLGKENILEATLGDYIEKQVSVLFLDIRGYTTLSEKMTPEENFRFVQSFHQRMGPTISKYQGFVNQYLGDGIMAIFPESSDGTLQAAIEMQQNLQAFNEDRFSQNKTPIRIGIGIHSGSLIMGIIGDEKRMDAATISDTVNAASRVEGLTKHFGTPVLLSEACVNDLKHPDNFNLRYLGQVQVKGKENAIKIYECFDGEEETSKDLKKATLDEFRKGTALYFDKKFKEAHAVFENICQKNPKDITALKFLENLNILMKEGINENWTGIEMMKTK